MISGPLRIFFALFVSYFFTPSTPVKKLYLQHTIDVPVIKTHQTTKQKQSQTRLFLAKVLIGYLMFCIALWLSK